MRIARVLVLFVVLGCKRDEPASVTVAPSSTPTAAPSVAPAFVQLRPGEHVLGDPFSVNPHMSFDLAVGAVGTLRIELVDRVAHTRQMELEPRDPRAILLLGRDIKPPRAHLEIKFTQQGVVALVEGSGGRSEDTAPIPNARRPSPTARLKAAVVSNPVNLPAGAYVPIAGFAWSAPDAAVPDPFAIDEAAPEPHWTVRVQFRPGA